MTSATPAQGIKIDLTRDVLFAYPTPILSTDVGNSESLNEGLRRIILAKRGEGNGAKRSNLGGWHSECDLFQWEGKEIATLRELVDSLTRQISAVSNKGQTWGGAISYDAWANVNERGDYNRTHNHPGSHLSGVYYVDPGDGYDDEQDYGRIEFQDPRGFLHMFSPPGDSPGKNIVIRPRPGKILIFPSYLFHTVHPYQGNQPRISIAFNAILHPTKDVNHS